MLRIYLDQAKWIDLSKFRVGHRQGGKFQDVYDIAMEAAKQGRASFVLSSAHYLETQSRADAQSRQDLGEMMAELSRFHTIAPVQVVVPAEIREFLTGEPLTSQINLFGVGFRHAFDTNVDMGSVDPATIAAVPAGQRAALTEKYNHYIEMFVLAAPSAPNDAARKMLEVATKIRSGGQKFADGQTTIGEHIDTHRLRGRLGDVTAATEIVDFLDPLIAECLRCGVDLNELIDTRENIRNLLESLPSRWVTSELRRVRLRNRQQPWTKSDLNDVLALSIAVPYCDIVVTERQWARHINQLGLAERYGTTVLHDLTELTEVIIAATIDEA